MDTVSIYLKDNKLNQYAKKLKPQSVQRLSGPQLLSTWETEV